MSFLEIPLIKSKTFDHVKILFLESCHQNPATLLHVATQKSMICGCTQNSPANLYLGKELVPPHPDDAPPPPPPAGGPGVGVHDAASPDPPRVQRGGRGGGGRNRGRGRGPGAAKQQC